MLKFFKIKSSKEKFLEKVLSSISQEALLAALEIYNHLISLPEFEKTGFEQQTINNIKKTWEYLNILKNNNADFKKFSNIIGKDELSFFIESSSTFDVLIKILIDNHNNESEAEIAFKNHPDLHKIIPAQYDNNRQLIEVLIEYIRNFQWELEHFINEYRDEIEKTI